MISHEYHELTRTSFFVLIRVISGLKKIDRKTNFHPLG